MSIQALSSYLERYPSDATWNNWVAEREVQREEATARQRPVLQKFFKGELSVPAFRKSMDSESKQYNLWGFRGGPQMFFNMVCNNNLDPDTLRLKLQSAITVPRNQVEAVDRIRQFAEFIRVENESVSDQKKRAPVGHIPLFLSYFWNIQEVGKHPIYYPSAVKTLDNLKLANLYDISEPDQRYDSYFTWMEKIRAEYGSKVGRPVDFTEIENFMYWIFKQSEEPEENGPEPSTVVKDIPEREPETEHTEIQWMIAKIGKLQGLKVHVARNDANRTWGDERLGDIGGDDLPLPGYYDEDRRVIERIDVIWFRGNNITHLFEVESSTSIISGLLRMSDLLTLQPSLNPALTIVAPTDREAEARKIMQRPTFRSMGEGEGGRRFEFKSFDDIRRQFEMEMRGKLIR